ncbi:MAG: VWA domain-containing protein [Planctomycetota bacterium]
MLAATPVAAQRPRSADEALARFEQVAQQSEAQRRRAAGDLGEFVDERTTAVLLAEFARAEGLSYRQTVVRALGESTRPGSVDALRQALADADNARLMDAAAEGLSRQGLEGVQALGAVLAAEATGSARRNSVCDGLGRAEGPAARDLLLGEVKRAAGRDRLPALRALRRQAGDAAVDAARLLLARDKDALVASTSLAQLAEHAHADAPVLSLELHRRLPATATAEQHAAVLHGLLLGSEASYREPMLVEAAQAQDPFGETLLPFWRRALADAAFVRWLADAAPSRKLAAERTAGAVAMGLVDAEQHATAAACLVRLLADRDPAVMRAAAASLGALSAEIAEPPLARLLASGSAIAQPIALEALHGLRATRADWPGELLPLAAARSDALRTAALQLLARCSGLDVAATLAAATPNLAHKSWSVRAAAIELLVTMRTPAAIPLLFERLDLEQARLHEDVVAALRELTALQFATTAEWRAFWQKEGSGFQVPPAKKDGRSDGAKKAADTTASYWDIPVRSDRVVFVVDVSGSMSQPFGTGSNTRLDEAKRQLQRVLGLLPPKAKANIVAFGNSASAFAESLQTIDDKRRKVADAFTLALQARGATNVHAGLELAFADVEVDTIFLLTDGRPSAGAIVEAKALAREVQRWNTGRGIRIHTVAIGGRSDFLEQLATDSGGEHTVAR